jgi:hypothetical protein
MTKETTVFQLSLDESNISKITKISGESNPLLVFKYAINTFRKISHVMALEKRVLDKQDVVIITRVDRYGEETIYAVPTDEKGLVEDKRVISEFGYTRKEKRKPISESPRIKHLVGTLVTIEKFKKTSQLSFGEALYEGMVDAYALNKGKQLAKEDMNVRLGLTKDGKKPKKKKVVDKKKEVKPKKRKKS